MGSFAALDKLDVYARGGFTSKVSETLSKLAKLMAEHPDDEIERAIRVNGRVYFLERYWDRGSHNGNVVNKAVLRCSTHRLVVPQWSSKRRGCTQPIVGKLEVEPVALMTNDPLVLMYDAWADLEAFGYEVASEEVKEVDVCVDMVWSVPEITELVRNYCYVSTVPRDGFKGIPTLNPGTWNVGSGACGQQITIYEKIQELFDKSRGSREDLALSRRKLELVLARLGIDELQMLGMFKSLVRVEIKYNGAHLKTYKELKHDMTLWNVLASLPSICAGTLTKRLRFTTRANQRDKNQSKLPTHPKWLEAIERISQPIVPGVDLIGPSRSKRKESSPMAKSELYRRAAEYLHTAVAGNEGLPLSEADLQQIVAEELYPYLSMRRVCEKKAKLIKKGVVPTEEMDELESSPYWMAGWNDDEAVERGTKPVDPQSRIPF